MASSMKYIGGGAFIPGIPARDLTAEEVSLYGKKKLKLCGLYKESSIKPQSDEIAEIIEPIQEEKWQE